MKNCLYVLSLSCCLFACTQVVDENEGIPKGRSIVLPNVSMNVSQEDAVNVACAFRSQQYGEAVGAQSHQLSGQASPISDAQNSPLAYVVNHEGGGWTMVCATKEYYPILAYSETYSFPLEQMANNGGLNLWLDELSQTIYSYRQFDTQTASQIALDWLKYTPQTLDSSTSGLPGGNSPEAVMCRNRLKELNETYSQDGWSFMTLSSIQQVDIPQRIYDTADQYSTPYDYTIVGLKDKSVYNHVGPLTTSVWGQENGYNNLCPNNSKAGCVPIAMAQLMYYHQYPPLFDWANMYDNIATYACQYLIAHVGNTIGVDYGSDGSSVSIIDAKMGFRAYGYHVDQKDHKNTDVNAEIIHFKRPVYMRGQKGFLQSGHAWICDGVKQNLVEYNLYAEYIYNGKYDNLGLSLIDNPDGFGGISYSHYHMNWGWYGKHNGWFIDATPLPGTDYNYNRENLVHPTFRVIVS